MAIRPQPPWTDQKIHVHAFLRLVALQLGRAVEHKAQAAGRQGSLDGLLDLLGRVRLVMALQPSGPRGGRPRPDWQLEEADADTEQLLRALVPNHPPLVDTPSTP